GQSLRPFGFRARGPYWSSGRTSLRDDQAGSRAGNRPAVDRPVYDCRGGSASFIRRGPGHTSFTPRGAVSCAFAASGAPRSARVEVLRLRVVDHDRVRGLLGVQLELLRELDADALRLQQVRDLGPVLQVRARPVAEGEAGAPVLQGEHVLHLVRVLT